jgi:hypothetical protein
VEALRYVIRIVGELLAGRYSIRIEPLYDIFGGQPDSMENQEKSRLIS